VNEVLAALICSALLASPADSQDSTRAAAVESRSEISCFDLAEQKLYPEHKMIVVMTSGAEVSGRFLGFPSRGEIRIVPNAAGEKSRVPRTFALAEVSELRIQKYRPLRPLYPVGGLLGGSLVGGLFGAAIFTLANGDDDGYYIISPAGVGALIGGAIGGLVGLVTGTVLAIRDPGMRSFSCDSLDSDALPIQ